MDTPEELTGKHGTGGSYGGPEMSNTLQLQKIPANRKMLQKRKDTE